MAKLRSRLSQLRTSVVFRLWDWEEFEDRAPRWDRILLRHRSDARDCRHASAERQPALSDPVAEPWFPGPAPFCDSSSKPPSRSGAIQPLAAFSLHASVQPGRGPRPKEIAHVDDDVHVNARGASLPLARRQCTAATALSFAARPIDGGAPTVRIFWRLAGSRASDGASGQ